MIIRCLWPSAIVYLHDTFPIVLVGSRLDFEIAVAVKQSKCSHHSLLKKKAKQRFLIVHWAFLNSNLKSGQGNMSPMEKTIIEKTLDLNQLLAKSKSHMYRGVFHALLLAIIFYNLLHTSVDNSWMAIALYYGQVFLIILLTLNLLFHLVKYTMIKISLAPVPLSPTQKKLLGVDNSEKWFKTPEKTPIESPSSRNSSFESEFTATTPMNLSAASWLSPVAPSESAVSTPNYSLGANSFMHQTVPHTPYYISQEFHENIIRDEDSLSKFLEEAEEMEKHAAITASVEQPGSVLSSFWNSPGPKSGTDVSLLLRRGAYQMASISPVQPSSSPGITPDDSNSPSSALSNVELWRRVKIDPSKLTKWNGNLRMWISLTILERLVKELDFIDEAFLRCGLSDLHLGSVGLDRLKKTASIPQVVASVPSLPRLVPFLELSPHQEYLVNRIRELAKGGSMSEFRWLSGGSLNGKSWEEHLPTDAALIMHLVATYLDLQLLPPPHRPDSRPFSSQYVITSPEKPPRGSTSPVIYQSQLNPPHFLVVDRDEVLDVPKGRNNVLYAFLLFLHILKTREHGMLGPVNLGRSGVNVLWVIDS